MKIPSTKVHGVLDYVVSIIVMGSPWLFGFARGGAETWVPVFIGAAGLAYSVFTNYEFGLVKQLSMRNHLLLDFSSGVLLAISPWLFGFSEYVLVPHLILGITEILAAAMTDPVPSRTSSSADGYSGSRPRGAH